MDETHRHLADGSTVISPVLTDVYTALASFIGTALPGVTVIRGLANRVPMPVGGFIQMQALFQARLRTSIDSWDMTLSDPTTQTVEQGMRIDMQIDCFGPTSSDWAATLSTLLRDEYGCANLQNCQPLYADEAKMLPLIDAEKQYEERWMLQAAFQYNPVVTIPQQFADVVTVPLIDVEVAYPA